MEPELIAVPIGRGLVVWHTPEQYERLIAGVDMEASQLASSTVPLQLQEIE